MMCPMMAMVLDGGCDVLIPFNSPLGIKGEVRGFRLGFKREDCAKNAFAGMPPLLSLRYTKRIEIVSPSRHVTNVRVNYDWFSANRIDDIQDRLERERT